MFRPLSFFCRSRSALLLLIACANLIDASLWAQAPTSFTASGYVRRDGDGNGDPSDPDTPMAGVIVRLHSDPNGDGNPADGAIIATTATDAGGFYEFNLPSGTYVIEQLDPPSAISTYDTQGALTDSRTAITISGSSLSDLDFLDFGAQLFAVSGRVFADSAPNDGLFGPTDQPVGAVLIRLHADLNSNGLIDPGEPLITDAATGITGRFGFGGLVAGFYTVQELDPASATSVNDRSGSPSDNQNGVQITTADVINADFLDQGITVASIRGNVRDDLNNNGNPADPDPPLAGVQLLLFTDPNADGNPFDGYAVGLTATNLLGNYTFPQLPTGSYVVFQFAPQGATSTWDAQGSILDGMVGVTIAGSDATGRDFLDTAALLGTASGFVTEDGSNQDGLFTMDDAEVAGVEFRLYADLDGNAIVSAEDVDLGLTTSIVGGSFQFTRLVYGLYVVQENVPAGATPVNDLGGSEEDGVMGFDLNSSDFQNLFFLNQGIAIASVSGSVRNDLNANGNPADPDPALPNVPITIHTDPNGDGNPADGLLMGSTVTNAFGAYQFPTLAARSYVITATDVVGASSTYDTDAPLNDNRIRVSLSGTNLTARDFLDTGAILSTVSGSVFNDGPTSVGVFSGDDVPLPGVFLRLYADANANGSLDLTDPLITTTATIRSGAYNFPGLPSGNYLVNELDPPGTTSLADSQGNPTDNLIALSLSGTNFTGRNFLDTGATFSNVIGQVRDDADSDGNIADPDQPIPGVTVRLYIDLYSDGQLTVEDIYLDGDVVTDSNGQFTFTNLPGGSYLLQEVDPRGGTSTGDSQGANDNLVGVQLTNANDSTTVFLDAYDPTGYLYDAVTGQILSGGSVSVSGPAAANLIMNGSSGQYVFETTTPGTYTITVIAPPGFIAAPLRSALPTALDPTGMTNPTALGSGENPTSPGFLTAATAIANPFHTQITLAPGDPLVINNNFPFVRIDPPSFAYWTASKPGAGGSATSNLDGDLTNDLIEYTFDTNPADGLITSTLYRVQHNSGTNRFTASYTLREQGRTDASVRVQVLANLANSPSGWTNATALPTSVSNGNGTRTVTLADLEAEPGFSDAEFGFVRFLVSLDADLNGTPEATSPTPAFGWQRRTIPASASSSWSASLSPSPATLLSGKITAVSGSSLNLADALIGTGNFPAASFANHFIEILDGPDAGHRLLIDTAASTGTLAAIQLASPLTTLTSLPGTLATAAFTIRPARTLATAFPPASFIATNDPATADRVQFFSNTTQSYTSYWLFSGGGNPYWVLVGDTNLANNRNTVLIDPAAGALIQRRAAPLTLTTTGDLRSTPFAFRLGTRQNLIANPWPFTQSPASRSLTTANGLTGNTQAATADSLSIWGADMNPPTAGFTSFFLFKSGPVERWVLQGDPFLNDRSTSNLFLPGRASFWKSITGLPAFVLPSPWTP
ncbi:MAG: SdrD B-like domain-containing protein [Verrucomicrobiaceae bacterium]|nr:SdrD B-like domain-containing protein [Verrucomicrobiaceae bacterium]